MFFNFLPFPSADARYEKKVDMVHFRYTALIVFIPVN